jgi:phosphatidylinositol-3-phosphatase
VWFVNVRAGCTSSSHGRLLRSSVVTPSGPPSSTRSVVVTALGAVAALLLAACGAGSAPPAPPGPVVPSAPGSVPRPAHVVVVVFENKAAEQVIGNPQAPFLTELAREGANVTDAHGETHPSQPNYIALLAGSTHGVTDDSCPQQLGDGPTLVTQLTASGRSFAGYSEGLPSPGFTGCSSPDGRYARKHDPWVDFSSTPPAANLPLTAMPADDAALPTVSIVVPDLCNDMHDCPVATGDAWARQHLAGYVAWARDHDSLLVVTFDEDDDRPQNHIPTFLVGPMVRPGDVGGRADHYTLLRTIEDMYGLPALGEAAHTAPLTGFWQR